MLHYVSTEELPGCLYHPNMDLANAASQDSPRVIPVHFASRDENVNYPWAATPAFAREAADLSWRAFASWKKTRYVTRRDLLARVANIFEYRSADLVRHQIEETPWRRLTAIRRRARMQNTPIHRLRIFPPPANISGACVGDSHLETTAALCLL